MESIKAKAKIFFVIFIMTAVNTLGQTASENFKIGAYSYPSPSVLNIVNWIDLSTLDWESEMKKYEFSERGIDNGCVFYSSGSSLIKAGFQICKCPRNLISIIWADRTEKGITKLDTLVNEIEPYYRETDDKGNYIFAFIINNFTYECTLHRDNSLEYVIVKKLYK